MLERHRTQQQQDRQMHRMTQHACRHSEYARSFMQNRLSLFSYAARIYGSCCLLSLCIQSVCCIHRSTTQSRPFGPESSDSIDSLAAVVALAASAAARASMRFATFSACVSSFVLTAYFLAVLVFGKGVFVSFCSRAGAL